MHRDAKGKQSTCKIGGGDVPPFLLKQPPITPCTVHYAKRKNRARTPQATRVFGSLIVVLYRGSCAHRLQAAAAGAISAPSFTRFFFANDARNFAMLCLDYPWYKQILSQNHLYCLFVWSCMFLITVGLRPAPDRWSTYIDVPGEFFRHRVDLLRDLNAF